MRDSIEQRDADALYRSAHTLKGAISNLAGFGDALDAAVQIERAGKDGDFDSARHLLPRLEDAVRDLEQRMAIALTLPAESEPMQANEFECGALAPQSSRRHSRPHSKGYSAIPSSAFFR